MSAAGYALLAVVTAAFLRIIFKHLVSEGLNPYVTLAFEHLTAFFILLVIFGVPSWETCSAVTLVLLFLNCLFWIFASVLDLRAYETLDASSAEIFNTLVLIIGVVWGIGFFNEGLSWSKGLGIAAVIGSIAYAASGNLQLHSRGALLKIASAVLVACACIADKYLSVNIDVRWIALLGYLIPGLIYAGVAGKNLYKLPRILVNNPALCLTPLFGAFSYYWWLLALAGGELTVTVVIGQTVMVFVFVFEFLFLRYRELLFQRCCTCSICLLGGLAACLG